MTRFDLKGWDLKQFVLGNKEFIKSAIALSLLFFGGMSPEINLLAAAVAKGILDVVDYWQTK